MSGDDSPNPHRFFLADLGWFPKTIFRQWGNRSHFYQLTLLFLKLFSYDTVFFLENIKYGLSGVSNITISKNTPPSVNIGNTGFYWKSYSTHISRKAGCLNDAGLWCLGMRARRVSECWWASLSASWLCGALRCHPPRALCSLPHLH